MIAQRVAKPISLTSPFFKSFKVFLDIVDSKSGLRNEIKSFLRNLSEY